MLLSGSLDPGSQSPRVPGLRVPVLRVLGVRVTGVRASGLGSHVSGLDLGLCYAEVVAKPTSIKNFFSSSDLSVSYLVFETNPLVSILFTFSTNLS